MASKNVLKSYIENGYYHVYNRGVEKRMIFQDDQDYKVFLNYLKTYLDPPTIDIEPKFVTINSNSFYSQPRPLNNFSKEIELLAYCLMPNHFHLLIKQNSQRSIEKFTKSLLSKYSTYFNKRNERVGGLFQGPYKAVLIEDESYLLHLSRYIHLNPSLHTNISPINHPYSSYSDYLGLIHTKWVKPDLILSFFKNAQKYDFKDVSSYQGFVEDYLKEKESLKDFVLED